MKLLNVTIPASANNFATSLIRRIFSSRSSAEKPKFLLRPVLMLSPSNPQAGIPLEQRYSSTAKLIVVFPAPDKPVMMITSVITHYKCCTGQLLSCLQTLQLIFKIKIHCTILKHNLASYSYILIFSNGKFWTRKLWLIHQILSKCCFLPPNFISHSNIRIIDG